MLPAFFQVVRSLYLAESEDKTKSRSPLASSAFTSSPASCAESTDEFGEADIKKYEQGTELGKGGQAIVYQHRCGSEVLAAKVFKFDREMFFSIPGQQARKEKIFREVRISLQTNHPHLLRARECFKCGDDGLVLLMPFYPLRTLAYNNACETFTMEQKRETLIQVLDGLQCLHVERTCHRDIKPSNILVKDLSPVHIVISDFGVSSIADPVTAVGSPWYLAPELRKAWNLEKETPHDTPVDIFSAGMLLIWMLGSVVPSEELERMKYLAIPNQWEACMTTFFRKAFELHPTGDLHEALMLAQQMVQYEPERRPHAFQCLNFSWAKSPRYTVKDPENQFRPPAFQRNIDLEIKAETKGAHRSSRNPKRLYYNEKFLSERDSSVNRAPYSSSCLTPVSLSKLWFKEASLFS